MKVPVFTTFPPGAFYILIRTVKIAAVHRMRVQNINIQDYWACLDGRVYDTPPHLSARYLAWVVIVPSLWIGGRAFSMLELSAVQYALWPVIHGKALNVCMGMGLIFLTGRPGGVALQTFCNHISYCLLSYSCYLGTISVMWLGDMIRRFFEDQQCHQLSYENFYSWSQCGSLLLWWVPLRIHVRYYIGVADMAVEDVIEYWSYVFFVFYDVSWNFSTL